MIQEDNSSDIGLGKNPHRGGNKISVAEAGRFILKNALSLVCSLFVAFGGVRVNKDGYKKRILVVFGGGIGDVIKRSIVCGYLKKYLSGYDIYYLAPYPLDLPYAKESIFFNYTRAKVDPRYYLDLVNRLRRVGFSKVIVMFPFWDGFLSFLGGDIKPDEVFCHKEAAPHPFYNMVSGAGYFLRYPLLRNRMKFIRVISGWDKTWLHERMPSDVGKHAYFISHAIAVIRGDGAFDRNGRLPLEAPHTEVVINEDIENEFLELLQREYDLAPQSYCVIGLASSTDRRNWQVEKFAEVAKFLVGRGLKIVISEHIKDKAIAEKFMVEYPEAIDLTAKTDIRHALILIKNARLTIANDTAFTHMAVALGIPNICVTGNIGLGADSLYGRKLINRWIFEDRKKYPMTPVFGLRVEPVIAACEDILEKTNGSEWKKDKFQFQYGSDQ